MITYPQKTAKPTNSTIVNQKKTNTKSLTKRSTAKKKNRQTHTPKTEKTEGKKKKKKKREKKKKKKKNEKVRKRERRFLCDLMMKSGYMHLLCLFCLL